MNKKLQVLLFGLSVFSTAAFSEVVVSEKAGLKNYSFSVDGITTSEKTIEGEDFSVATLKGVQGYEAVKFEVGSPEVPVIRFMVKVDKASDIKISSYSSKSIKSFGLRSELKPSLHSPAKIPGATYKVVRNANFKSLAGYPAESFAVEAAGSIRGQAQFMVTLYPVEYVGATNTLQIVRSYNVSVKEKAEDKSDTPMPGIAFVVGAKFASSPSLAKYIAFKQSLGFGVYVLNMAQKVTADTTRAQLKALYKAQKDLRYAVIIGDADDVPGKVSSNIAGLTDHYFSAIDTDNYATDMNGPDIGVGRIAVNNEEQLATVLRKYTRYVTGEFPSTSWLANISFLATDDRYEVAEATHNYVIDTHTGKLGYKGTFPTANQVGGDKLYAITNKATTTQVMTSISQGRAIIDYSGHGATTYWAGPHVGQAEVRTLNSASSSLPFVISNACITGDYRVSESFAETWQRQEWGAIMYWGSMDSTYWDEDDILERRMFDGIFTLGKRTFADITTNALSEMWKQYGGKERSAYYWETYHMFGDPSIPLRLK